MVKVNPTERKQATDVEQSPDNSEESDCESEFFYEFKDEEEENNVDDYENNYGDDDEREHIISESDIEFIEEEDGIDKKVETRKSKIKIINNNNNNNNFINYKDKIHIINNNEQEDDIEKDDLLNELEQEQDDDDITEEDENDIEERRLMDEEMKKLDTKQQWIAWIEIMKGFPEKYGKFNPYVVRKKRVDTPKVKTLKNETNGGVVVGDSLGVVKQEEEDDEEEEENNRVVSSVDDGENNNKNIENDDKKKKINTTNNNNKKQQQEYEEEKEKIKGEEEIYEEQIEQEEQEEQNIEEEQQEHIKQKEENSNHNPNIKKESLTTTTTTKSIKKRKTPNRSTTLKELKEMEKMFKEGTYSIQELCTMFSLSNNTIYRFLNIFKESGGNLVKHFLKAPKEINRKKSDRTIKKLEALKAAILEIIHKNPKIYQQEIQINLRKYYKINVSQSTVSRLMKTISLVKKKPQKVFIETNTDVNIKKRYKYCELYKDLNKDKLLFMDECGINNRINREKGWVVKGSNFHCEEPADGCNKYSVIMAMSFEKIHESFVKNGSINGEDVVEFIEGHLSNKYSEYTLVLDNHRAHKTPKVTEALKKYDIKYIFLPPYTPLLNPIESVFHELKSIIRELRANDQEGDLKENIDKAIEQIKTRNYERYKENIDRWVEKGLRMEQFVKPGIYPAKNSKEYPPECKGKNNTEEIEK